MKTPERKLLDCVMKPMTPEEKDACEGFMLSICCQSLIGPDSGICHECGEHADNECSECGEKDCPNRIKIYK